MFDVKICVSFDGKVKRLKECDGIVLFSDKLVKTRKAVAMVDEKYNIKLFNFKLLDEKSVKAYGRLVNAYIDEYYITAFRISTTWSRLDQCLRILWLTYSFLVNLVRLTFWTIKS